MFVEFIWSFYGELYGSLKLATPSEIFLGRLWPMGQVVLSKRSDGNVNLFMIRKFHYESKILSKETFWVPFWKERWYLATKLLGMNISPSKSMGYNISVKSGMGYINTYISGIYCQLGEKIYLSPTKKLGEPQKRLYWYFPGKPSIFACVFPCEPTEDSPQVLDAHGTRVQRLDGSTFVPVIRTPRGFF